MFLIMKLVSLAVCILSYIDVFIYSMIRRQWGPPVCGGAHLSVVEPTPLWSNSPVCGGAHLSVEQLTCLCGANLSVVELTCLWWSSSVCGAAHLSVWSSPVCLELTCLSGAHLSVEELTCLSGAHLSVEQLTCLVVCGHVSLHVSSSVVVLILC